MKKVEYKNYTFPVIVTEEKAGGYVVTNPALEGCYSQGETLEEALDNIKEATALCLENRPAPKHIPRISLHLVNLKERYA